MFPLPQRSLSLHALAASATLFSLTLLPAQTSWQHECPPSSPPPRTDHGLAGDYASGTILLFGGADNVGWLGDTWQWDGASWTQKQPFASPPGRRLHAMAGSSSQQQIVLFGGCNTAGNLGDTWVWAGNNWTQRTPPFGPSPRSGHAMAYDRANQAVAMFGGNDGSYRNDTWSWDGNSWTSHGTLNAPSPRCGHAMAYDIARQQLVLFGGENGAPLDDMWAWDGLNWTLLNPPSSPPARSGHGLAYDTSRQTVVLFGGFDGTSFLGDTWEWNGSDWSRVLLSLQPAGRQAVAMTSGPMTSTVVFGGWNGRILGDTWTLHRSGVQPFERFGTSCGGDLTNTMPPWLGQQFEIRIDNLPPQRQGVILTGASNTMWGPVTLPQSLTSIGALGCTLYVSGEVTTPFNTQASSTVTFGFGIANTPALIGASFYNQALTIDPTANTLGIIASNAGKATLLAQPNSEIVECFADAQQFDAGSSGGTWVGGAGPGTLGLDGLHGEFDPTLGQAIGPGTFLWNTDNMLIPRTHTLSGVDEIVTSGVFRFSKMIVPAGITVRFVGSQPARLYVRGEMRVDGTVELNGETLPEPNGASLLGQTGGSGGAFGGSGGQGGDQSNGTNQPRFSGQDGQSIQVPAGHAYAGQTIGTGGLGSSQFPNDDSNVTAGLRGFFTIQVAAGGGGGGFMTPGGQGAALQSTNEFGVNQPQALGPPAAGGSAFSLFPLPPATSVFDHFLVGGSAGGGAGSHPYNSNVIVIGWHSGGGGGGGGGALGARVGSSLTVSPSGQIAAHGGSTQASASNNFGTPGGGGAGGAIVLQCSQAPTQAGLVDVSGGLGGSVRGGFIAMESKGGDGAAGYLRVEAPGPLPGNPADWTGVVDPTATSQNIAVLQEQDSITGNQSLWYPTGSPAPPQWLRYEIEATVSGNAVVYSDDGTVGPLAGAGRPVQFFVQGAEVDASGQPIAGTETPWRRYVGPFGAPGTPSLDGDAATGFRFVLLFDRSFASSIVVNRVRVLLK